LLTLYARFARSTLVCAAASSNGTLDEFLSSFVAEYDSILDSLLISIFSKYSSTLVIEMHDIVTFAKYLVNRYRNYQSMHLGRALSLCLVALTHISGSTYRRRSASCHLISPQLDPSTPHAKMQIVLLWYDNLKFRSL